MSKEDPRVSGLSATPRHRGSSEETSGARFRVGAPSAHVPEPAASSQQRRAVAPPRRHARPPATTEEVVTVKLDEAAKRMLKEAAEGVNALAEVRADGSAAQRELQQALGSLDNTSEQLDGPDVGTTILRPHGPDRRTLLLAVILLIASLGFAANHWVGARDHAASASSLGTRSAAVAQRTGADPVLAPVMVLDVPTLEPTEPATSNVAHDTQDTTR